MTSAHERVEELTARMLGDLGAILSAPLILLGTRLGFYRELGAARHGLTPAELARRTATDETAVRLWLRNQACGGLIEHDADSDRFRMTPQQIVALGSEEARDSLRAVLESVCGFYGNLDAIVAGFRAGAAPAPPIPPCAEAGLDGVISRGLERLLHPHCVQSLTTMWIPSLSGLETRLRRGVPVAELSCGAGDATLTMAAAYPRSYFYGFDHRPEMIDRARSAAAEAGAGTNCRFSLCSRNDLPSPAELAEGAHDAYEVVLVLPGASQGADLAASATPVRRRLAPSGVWVVVEPQLSEHAEDRFNPLLRASIAAAALTGAPRTGESRSEDPSALDGASWRDAAIAAGFGRVRSAIETPFHVITEARA